MRPDVAEEPTLKTRASKNLAAATGIAAIVASVPFAINTTFATNAYADPPAETSTPVPDPQGPGCDAFKTALPNWKDLATQPVGKALASIPDVSTFNALVSGAANPAVNIVPVLENGPYVVFAPSNEAFDADLRARDPRWGVRDLAELVEVGSRVGLAYEERVAMPANNFTVVFRRTPRRAAGSEPSDQTR